MSATAFAQTFMLSQFNENLPYADAGVYDPALAESLFNNNAGLLYGTIIRIVNEHAVAEEVLQEVFLQTIAERQQPQSSPLKLITRMNQLARSKARAMAETLQPQPSPEKTTRDFILMLLSKLTDLERLLVELTMLRGKSQAEVSEQLNLPLSVIRSKTRQAILKMRDWLGD